MLVDANIFNGFFQMEMGKSHDLCGCPTTLINSASINNPIFHDLGKIVEAEWRGVVDQYWFDSWLAEKLQSGCIQYLSPTHDAGTEKRLASVGFPRSRDIVYVRIGITLTAQNGVCLFYTEDMDFYDPAQKGCAAKRRKKILRNSSGPVPKLLSKIGINVRCTPALASAGPA